MSDNPIIRKVFGGSCDFRLGIANLVQLPPSHIPEIAFAGRSNVGKSSLINAVMGRKIAHVSHTPGRTQQLNFFDVGDHFWLVDMPGYGYAKVSKSLKDNWNKVLRDYLRGRPNLRVVFLLIDSRHGLKENDLEMMKMLDQSAVSYRIILTKADEPKKADLEATKALIEEKLKKHPAAFPEAFPVSSWKKTGIEELQEMILDLI
ncbi:MAG: YihA family ribosome biogenesis GTP-binding protein [Alphaproteobacteria bacterium]|nr:YihA family ribosome biogenesis GTP-binding protein [Alphaproteobacteria bacterium]MCB1551100.1 YihA family ribosome biogenesis GTP-binding protein [Alphaproteobacteria bacterium]MCB9985769.1 YihA family ribosome biogenesis GTP-binding protein [Micavibrio sp.]HRK97599.1 ribosome biogenesis GTP-binding protein YihA/YsxC [Alphaproteobacteria bacterium]